MDNKKRYIYLDTVAGVLIIYMIFMHCCQFTYMTDTQMFKILQMSFVGFMAWFFFKSGMFYKENVTIRDTVKKSIEKIAKPYLSFLIIGYVLLCLFLLLKNSDWSLYVRVPIKQIVMGGGGHSWGLHLWFLVCLMCTKCFSCFLIKVKLWGVILIGLLGLALSYISLNIVELRPYWGINIFPAMFFYGVGYYLKQIQFNKYIVYTAFFVYVISIFLYPSYVSFQSNRLCYGLYLLWLLYAIANIVVWNNISRLLPNGIPLVTQIGKQSLYWYAAHWMFICIIREIFKLLGNPLSNGQSLIIMFFFVILLLYLLKPLVYNTRLKRLLGF